MDSITRRLILLFFGSALLNFTWLFPIPLKYIQDEDWFRLYIRPVFFD